jgi:hypothetical protein
MECKTRTLDTAISHEVFCAATRRTEDLPDSQKPVRALVPWLGKKVLGLASGGGQQGALLSAHGYEVTIMDNSGASSRLTIGR